MYAPSRTLMVSATRAADEAPDAPDEQAPRRARPGISANVIMLGVTSMFTDISSESVNAIITLYLLFQLRYSFLELGLFQGIYLGLTGVVTVWGAVITDRHGRYKEIAGAGYATDAADWPAGEIIARLTDKVGRDAVTVPLEHELGIGLLAVGQAGRMQRELHPVGLEHRAVLGHVQLVGLAGVVEGDIRSDRQARPSG